MRGVEELLDAGITNQLFIYLCQVLPNTEMAETAYRERFGLQTKVIQLAEIHGEARPDDFVTEYEEIVIGTHSMPHEAWKTALRFSYVMMLCHSLKLAYYVLILLRDRYQIPMHTVLAFISERAFTVSAPLLTAELDAFDAVIARMVNDGAHRGTLLPEYGDIYWDVEEAAFLRLTRDTDAFYLELTEVIADCLRAQGITIVGDESLIAETLIYQHARIPTQRDVPTSTEMFEWNLPEYFDRRFGSSPVRLERRASWLTVTPTQWNGDRRRFAKESILWGRKSGTLLTPCTFGALQEVSCSVQ
jgi:putative methyltransferase